ncbi:UDP-galactose-lipid carrier transferase [Leptospira ognonensis]|uniref:UDP-galactose-lipid carrier transferase n=1 Tax=Leptospira ognonensis TaxID=2484945 RepID=A0A4R9K7X4_9LEPT|nr:UDP-galactose-lipid carrier transferase [Leptospira ognonensis]TGL62686.1 UDP-galactose-lipid carrier transferase [Leptospira ognonensis]
MKKVNLSDRILKLEEVNVFPAVERNVYKAEMKKLKTRINRATLYAKYLGRPIVFVFEGWDAAGKGGAIRRLTQEIDPRLYEVHNIAAPDPQEKVRHYLWRFWNRIPNKGYVGIFDRSWYGRVLVERVEGFCSEEEWSRSYEEIVLFEEQLANFGTIIIKFWLHITSEEQLARFEARKNDPLRRWKLTDEDWRNREKWGEYVEAANEMFLRTDTPFAPWKIVPARDKYFARIDILSKVVDTLERELAIPKKFR